MAPPVGREKDVSPTIDTEYRRSCINDLIDTLEKERKNADKSGKSSIDKYISNLQSSYGIPESQDSIKTKEDCDNMFSSNQDDFKECGKIDTKKARGCYKSAPAEDGIMQSEAMQMATPLLGMVSGADTLLGAYTAMNDQPSCYLSKDDFIAKEDKLNDQKKDLEEKIKKNMEDAETAQNDYSAKLKDWAEKEGAIADRLEAIPGETAENKDKLDSAKVKVKMEADSKYAAILDQMSEMRSKYNQMVDQKSVAMAENNEFSVHDKCAEIAVGNDPAKQKASPQPSAQVQASFAGAFAQGKILTTNIQKRYDNCVNVERKKIKALQNQYESGLKSIKSKLDSYETVLGKIDAEKLMAEQEINKQIAKLATSADAEIKKLARDYQRIQADKTNEQTLLKQKLARLESENKKNSQQLAILGMKLQAYQSKRPPKNSDGKSMAELMDQCGERWDIILKGYKESCCSDGIRYTGTGSAMCKAKYSDFTVDPPKKEKATPAKSSNSDKTKKP